MGCDGRRVTMILSGILVLALQLPVAAVDLSLRANGWYAGKGDISDGSIKCDVPSVSTAIPSPTAAFGLWNTFGVPSIFFPDTNNPYAAPCGGWLQLTSSLAYSGITIDRVQLRLRIPGTRPAWAYVPTRNAFPTACRPLRRATIFTSARLAPSTASIGQSSSGAPNTAFVRILPMIPAGLLECLRSQYAAVPPDMLQSLSVVVVATAVGTTDTGQRIRANPVAYTLNLRRSCGNLRVDDGEQCDTLGACSGGLCKEGTCTHAPNVACEDNADCIGQCRPPGTAEECTCDFSAS